MGALPDWYPLIRAARYLGVPPWTLLDQPALWRDYALISEAVEAEVQDLLAKQQQQSAS